MPTYEYECEKTGRRFEVFQNVNDDPLKRCPECGSKVRRLVGGGVAVVFKGSGFHATDYRTPTQTPSCGRSRTCCGRDEPCSRRPCDR